MRPGSWQAPRSGRRSRSRWPSDGDWRRALLIVSVVSVLSLAAWLVLVRGGAPTRALRAEVPRLPWRYATAWLLVAAFGLQSLLYYGCVAWLPNVFVERGWTTVAAGSLVAIFNGVGLITTVGVPLVADRLGTRRRQLVLSSSIGAVSMVGIVALPAFAYLWVAMLGLALGTVFPLVLTLPLDVTDEPGQVGSVAALMLLGGYVVSAIGPFALGAARDATGNFEASLWLLVAVAIGLVACCFLLSPGRLRQGIRREQLDAAPRLRRADDRDSEAIARLVESAYQHYRPLIGRTPIPMLTDYAVAVRDHEVWVLDAGGAVVGVLELDRRGDHLWLENVAVSPDWQKRGLGRQLLAHAEAVARRDGQPEIRLLTNERYLANIAMYERYGYRETHRQPHLGTDLVHFSKVIDGGTSS